jgi:peptidoglycan hydrolase CwlO-like protein
MKKILLLILAPLALLILSTSITLAVSIEECEKDDIPADKVGECIKILSEKVTDLGNQKKTLSSQIAQFDTQIKLTQTKISEAESTIAQLEKEIGVLGFRIGYITESVDRLEVLLKQRIVATYQQSFVSNLEIIVSSANFSDLILRTQYLKQVQENDKKLLANLLLTKSNYANQKDEREEKQTAIEANRQKLLGLKTSLDQQKVEKQTFLEITKNDEARYQRLLAQAQAEQAIVFGGGDDVFLRDVNQGDSIGSIATHSASPGCSSGAHLHFEVHKDGSVQNPNNYLKSASYSYSYPPEQESYYGTISPSGDLPWPLNETIIIHQGFGSHPFAQSFYPSGSHMGIDMDSGSSTVKAVKGGKLYGGSYNCSNGKLYYAKIEHDDGLVTWYLHMIPS